ncbi:C-C chemokine receptor type 4 [Microcaecilia unicolor]|uniref:C-C chemokine receptor type 4-like n=1 Tax=Microcaecilia unicolor TaxID=1415580 RepID=A0A6P7X6X0_9AMPH|nr:C-C chemokine receptor type 4-like [Microcaecilia unicolor]
MNWTEASSTTDMTYNDDYDSFPTPCSKESIRNFGKQFLPSLYVLVFVFGLLGNSLVVWVLVQRERLKSMTDVYLLNLAISDLIFVFFLPFWAYYAVDQWVFGMELCKIISATYLVGFYSGIFFIMLMSIDRYLAIVHVVFAMKARTVTYGTITSIIVWAVAILASTPELVFNELQIDQNHTTCKSKYSSYSKIWKIIHSLKISALGLLIPFAVMVFSYSMIIKVLLRCKNEKKKKAIRLIFIVMVVFFISWAPYNIVLFLQLLYELGIVNNCKISKELDYSLQVTEVIALIHCCLNPIIYVFLGEKFRKHLRVLFYKCSLCVFFCDQCGFLNQSVSDSISSSHSQSTREPREHLDVL